MSATRRQRGTTGARWVAGLAVLAVLAVLAGAASVSASQVTVADRESSYPAGVSNVTHEPWAPQRGDDVRVTLVLEPDARVPNSVSLLFCRVEPSYVCGIPIAMTPGRGAHTWAGIIAWNYGSDVGPERFIKDDTRHVGYNVTMRFTGENGTERVSAPTGNFWVPDTYPEDSEGVYYFLSYTGTEARTLPAPAAWMPALALAALVFAARRMRHGA